ncbi:MAG TPA: tetratricopeptide repeat protein [Acidimicrobiales bacterium]|nr:tetratricopeptide repeat protein [Acidimicrobiales bacterium]
MALRIALAGRVEVEAEGGPVDTGRLGSLGRLTLAYLVTERHRPVPRHELADVLWGEAPPRSWETALRGAVSKVRAVLAAAGLAPMEALTTSAGCYQLHLPAGTVVDVEEAAEAVERATDALASPGQPAGRAGQAAAGAAAIASRRFLPGASGSWVDRRQAELEDLRLQALEVVSDASAVAGDWAAALAAAEEAVTLEPFRESARLRVLAAHAGAGNRAEALRAYERARRLLAEELGMDPSPALQAAYVALLGNEDPTPAGRVVPISPPPVPPPPVAPPPPPGLPAPLTSFVGRADAIAEVERLLSSARLLSLTGTGGMGKTRLALRVAADVAAADPAAVALVELGPLSDPDLVPQQVLSALGLSEQAGRSPLDTVTSHLCTRPVLLVLDNCEHVLEAAAGVAGSLLRACADLRVLATTREPLKVAGEVVWRVPTLSVPDPTTAGGDDLTLDELRQFEAVRLFLDRAAAVRPDLDLGDADAPALAAVVRRLDGIPLAVELAAGRVAMFSVAELAERLDDRFRLLAGGSRSSPERHQTLRGAVDWTYDALAPAEATMFTRLSVFASAFSLAAAEEVAAGDGIKPGDVAGLVSSLVDKSMVVADHGPGATRYRLLETMRRYGLERLGEDRANEATRRHAHLAWAAGLAVRAESALRGPDQAHWLEVLEVALDDIRAALAWGGDNPGTEQATVAVGLAAALERFWEVRGYLSEGRRWLESLLAAGGAAAPAVRARALASAAILAQRQGDYGPARAMHTESLRLAREAGDERGVAAAVHGLANLAVLQGDFAAARPLYEQVLAIGRALGDDNVVAAALTNLGTVAHNQADFAEAEGFSRDSLAVRRRMGDRHGIAMVTGNLAYLAFQLGDHTAARTLYGESLALQRQLGDRPGIANSLANLGYLALTEGDLADASSLLEESLALAGELGDKYWMALSLLRLAKVARAAGDHARASELDARALTLASGMGAKRAMAEWLEGLARTAVARGAHRRAIVLLGAAQAVRDELGAPLPPAERPGRDADLAAAQAAVGRRDAEAAWDEGRAMPLEDAVRLASSD